MKRFMIVVSVVSAAFLLFGCGKTKILHCDKCGKEVEVAQNSNMEEEWILFCEDCGDISLK